MTTSGMSDADMEALARRFVESLGKLGSDETARMLAPDAVFHLRIRSESLPMNKDVSGKQFCAELQPMMKSVFPDGVRHEVKSTFVSGNKAVVESECHGHSISGRYYNNNFAFILTIENGMIADIREYTDFLHTYEIVFQN